MSITMRALAEMKLAKFPEEEIRAMGAILTIFFDHWDSGGAVSVMAPVLQRLIAGKPLSPITDEPDQWVDVSNPAARAEHAVFQHRRLSTVFKEAGVAYDIDVRGRPPISFPYYPERAEVPDPVIVVETSEKEVTAAQAHNYVGGYCRACGGSPSENEALGDSNVCPGLKK